MVIAGVRLFRTLRKSSGTATRVGSAACRSVVAVQGCVMSKRERDARHDAKRRYDKPWRRLYKTARWLALRKRQRAAHPLCAWCMEKGKIVPATVVHHKTPHEGNERLFFDIGNLASLCKPCHDSTAQQIEKTGYSSNIGEDGWPADVNHPANKR